MSAPGLDGRGGNESLVTWPEPWDPGRGGRATAVLPCERLMQGFPYDPVLTASFPRACRRLSLKLYRSASAFCELVTARRRGDLAPSGQAVFPSPSVRYPDSCARYLCNKSVSQGSFGKLFVRILEEVSVRCDRTETLGMWFGHGAWQIVRRVELGSESRAARCADSRARGHLANLRHRRRGCGGGVSCAPFAVNQWTHEEEIHARCQERQVGRWRGHRCSCSDRLRRRQQGRQERRARVGARPAARSASASRSRWPSTRTTRRSPRASSSRTTCSPVCTSRPRTARSYRPSRPPRRSATTARPGRSRSSPAPSSPTVRSSTPRRSSAAGPGWPKKAASDVAYHLGGIEGSTRCRRARRPRSPA